MHAGLHVDETAALSNWHVPLPHALEDWSDARSPGRQRDLIQPVVRPMYDSRSLHEVLAALTSDEPVAAQALVRQTWAAQLADDNGWANALKIGFVARAAAECASAAAHSSIDEAARQAAPRRGRDRHPPGPDDPRRQLRE